MQQVTASREPGEGSRATESSKASLTEAIIPGTKSASMSKERGCDESVMQLERGTYRSYRAPTT